ncbi:uncharacterized protein Triagg1_9400 [Trichoderma aggressivum f. europaeum]|uniref:MFS transporter n=1 Tax=Trichoderma aggressivum f. europaeum TaxID=173218 RepID=A0AAE1I725_9HYPO|nr:hypothetical protein Triagg1_9400 [Trichoderma aggressivum f. europaeum]
MEPESSPLLQGSPPSTTPVDFAGYAHAGGRRRTRLYMLIYLLVFLDCFSGFLLDVPLIQLLERTVCWREARRDSLLLMVDSPPFCKSPAVQREVAIINGFKGSFDSLSGLLTALIYGSLADKKGRKPIIILSFAGLYLHLLWILFVCITPAVSLVLVAQLIFSGPGYNRNIMPTRLVWTASVFLMIGGGHKVFMSMLYTMLSEGLSAGISGGLYTLSGIKMLSSTFSPLMSGFLMTFNLWTPFQLALLLNSICFPVMLLLPETLTPPPRAAFHAERARLIQQSTADQRPGESPMLLVPTEPPTTSGNTVLQDAAASILQLIRQSLGIFSHQRQLSAILFVSIMHSFTISNTLILPQYASEKLHWEFHHTTTLLSIKYGVTLLTTGILFPIVVVKTQHRPITAQRALNLRIIQACLCCSSIGYLCIAVATEPVSFLAGADPPPTALRFFKLLC